MGNVSLHIYFIAVTNGNPLNTTYKPRTLSAPFFIRSFEPAGKMAARQRPTAAPLRLALQPAGADRLALHLLKRRGPPLAAPLRLALPPVLSAAACGKAALARSTGVPVPQRPLRTAAFVDLTMAEGRCGAGSHRAAM